MKSNYGIGNGVITAQVQVANVTRVVKQSGSKRASLMESVYSSRLTLLVIVFYIFIINYLDSLDVFINITIIINFH